MKEKLKMHKKGQVFNALGQLGVGIATLAIVLVITFLIISQGGEQIESIEGLNGTNKGCETSLACNSTATLTEAVDDIPEWVPLVVIASIGAILLGLVAAFKRR